LRVHRLGYLYGRSDDAAWQSGLKQANPAESRGNNGNNRCAVAKRRAIHGLTILPIVAKKAVVAAMPFATIVTANLAAAGNARP
jgi:hypothetical protein